MKYNIENKGFSLVELIIVIAIMAILSAALAPQLMKYIEKSRVSTDASTCKSIESCINAALAEEKAWNVVAYSGGNGNDLTFNVKKDENTGKLAFSGLAQGHAFRTEIEPLLVGLENPKQTGMNSYKVHISVEKDDVNGTFKVTDIEVTTSNLAIEKDSALGVAPNP